MAPTVKVVKARLPKNSETSATSGSYSKAVSDAVGAGTIIGFSTTKAGSYIIATIILS
jgi:hypothetical protein